MAELSVLSGNLLVRHDKLGTEQACCCSQCSGECPCVSPCCCGRLNISGAFGCITPVDCCTPATPHAFTLRLENIPAEDEPYWDAAATFDSCSCKWYILVSGCGPIGGTQFGIAEYRAFVDPDPNDCYPAEGEIALTSFGCFWGGCSYTPQLFVDKP